MSKRKIIEDSEEEHSSEGVSEGEKEEVKKYNLRKKKSKRKKEDSEELGSEEGDSEELGSEEGDREELGSEEGDREELGSEEGDREELGSEEGEKILLNFAKLLGLGSEEDPVKESKTKYLNSISFEKRRKLLEEEEKFKEYDISEIPIKYRILMSDIDEKTKARILCKAEQLETLEPSVGEYHKIKKYLDGVMKVPFGVYKKICVDMSDGMPTVGAFLRDVKEKLDKSVYSQENAKNSILQIMAKWISNPETRGNVIGLCGPAGVGKTSIVKDGLAKALNIPFGFIPLGGSSHSSMLEGADQVYEGSSWGRIVDILMESKCMNPVLFFDELDKISETKEGNEIASLLIHLTDPTQNKSFKDRYFPGIDFDLSRSLIIFSFNDINAINPILRDRINIVNLGGLDAKEKTVIAEKYAIGKIIKNVGMPKKSFSFAPETYKVIVETYCNEKGVRKMEQCLESLIMKLNLFYLTGDYSNLQIKGKMDISFPLVITPEIALKILDPVYRKDDMNTSVRMMYI